MNPMRTLPRAMGFLRAPLGQVETVLCAWLKEIRASREPSFRARAVSGGLDDVLQSRLPLTMRNIERYLLVPTDSPWTAYVDSLRMGTDPAAVAYLARRMQCMSVHIVTDPRNAVVLSVFGPEIADGGTNTLRDIRLLLDVDGWIFREAGQPLPFEDERTYRAARPQDRFTINALESYLRELGIRAVEEEFYLPHHAPGARLIESVDNPPV